MSPDYRHCRLKTVDTYKVDLKDVSEEGRLYTYRVTDEFFASIDAPAIRKGSLGVRLLVKKNHDVYELSFQIEGTVVVSCDRCLDDMDIPVDVETTLKAKKASSVEDDDMIGIPENEECINVGWLIYECIVLNLPLTHAHEEGKCNQAMMDVLKEHLCSSVDDDFETHDEEENSVMDPRWDKLKEILNNN